jgi:hypothetical protein
VVPKSALGSGGKFAGLQNPDKTTVHHALHCLTQATRATDRSADICLRAVSTRFQNGDGDSFFPAIRHQALCMRLYKVAETPCCERKVLEFRYGYHHNKATCCSSGIMRQGVRPR